MSTSPEQPALEQAIEKLYKVYSCYALPEVVEGCPCCVDGSDQEKIHNKPLRRLSAEDLSRYAFKAMTTWGSVEDFKHFLPRLLELITDANSITQEMDLEVLLGKLRYAKWQNWPQEEQVAVSEYLVALWQYVLTLPTEDILMDEYVCAYAQAIDDLMPYLTTWETTETDSALNHLLVFVDEQQSLYRGKLSNSFWTDQKEQMRQVIAWVSHLQLA